MAHSIQRDLRVKFCGLTRPEDVRYAIALGVNAVGVILVPGSARCVSIEAAQRLRTLVPAHIDFVAVVQNPSRSYLQQVITQVDPDILQFHGDEPAAFCSQFGVPFWKAIHVTRESKQVKMQGYEQAKALLFDAASLHGAGGLGVQFDWNLLPKIQFEQRPVFILSGGLNAASVAQAIQLYRAGWIEMLDLSSGIEAQGDAQVKGVKSHDRMFEFIQKLRDAQKELE